MDIQRGSAIFATLAGPFAGAAAAGTKGPGMEFSHWIPKRSGGPTSIFNGNYVSIEEHALSDPYRYQFMPRAWKDVNPLPPTITQQWNRIPNIYKGTVAGVTSAAVTSGNPEGGCGCH